MAKRTDNRSKPAPALTPQEIHEALRKKPFSPEQQEVLAQLRWGKSIQEAMTSIGYSRSAFDRWRERNYLFRLASDCARDRYTEAIADAFHQCEGYSRRLIDMAQRNEAAPLGLRVRCALAMVRRDPSQKWLPRPIEDIDPNLPRFDDFFPQDLPYPAESEDLTAQEYVAREDRREAERKQLEQPRSTEPHPVPAETGKARSASDLAQAQRAAPMIAPGEVSAANESPGNKDASEARPPKPQAALKATRATQHAALRIRTRNVNDGFPPSRKRKRPVTKSPQPNLEAPPKSRSASDLGQAQRATPITAPGEVSAANESPGKESTSEARPPKPQAALKAARATQHAALRIRTRNGNDGFPPSRKRKRPVRKGPQPHREAQPEARSASDLAQARRAAPMTAPGEVSIANESPGRENASEARPPKPHAALKQARATQHAALELPGERLDAPSTATAPHTHNLHTSTTRTAESTSTQYVPERAPEFIPNTHTQRLDAVFLNHYTIHRHETAEDFAKLHAEMIRAYEPVTPREELTVLRITQKHWALRRIDTFEMAISESIVTQTWQYHPGANGHAAIALKFLEENSSLEVRFFDRMRDYRNHHEKSLERFDNLYERIHHNRIRRESKSEPQAVKYDIPSPLACPAPM